MTFSLDTLLKKEKSKTSFFKKTITAVALYIFAVSYAPSVQSLNPRQDQHTADEPQATYALPSADYKPQPFYEQKKPYEVQEPQWMKDYTMGEAFGMVDLNTRQIFLNEERIKYPATDGEMVKIHEGVPGHLTYGSDEWLTRVNTYTTSTTGIENNRKYGA